MIQLYFLTLVYLLFTSLLLIAPSYDKSLIFILKVKNILISRLHWLNFYFLCGLLIGIMNLAFPISPGPAILGDFIPSMTIIGSAIFIRYYQYSLNEANPIKIKKERTIGFFILFVAVLHFIFPSIVLI